MKIISLWTSSFLEKKGLSFSFHNSVESSNDLAKAQAFQTLDNPSLFLVDHQSQGRGSQGRQWENSDLMLSFLWNKKDCRIQVQVCEDFAKDTQQALQTAWPDLPIYFKAPNDLYLKKKKLAGLLLEVLSQGSRKAFILGLGLNVFSAPKSLPASCLKDQVKNLTQESWEVFLSALIENWSFRLRKL